MGSDDEDVSSCKLLQRASAAEAGVNDCAHDDGRDICAPIDSNNPGWWYLAPKGSQGQIHSMWFHIPSDVNCPSGRCSVQFTWKTANSCNPHPAAYCNYYHHVVGRRILGARIGIAVASASLTATQRTIAKRPWGIDSVAAKCSQPVLRSTWLAEVCLRHLQPQLPQLPMRRRRLLQVRLLQWCHQRLHRLRRPFHRHRHLQRCSTALAFRTQIATATRGVQMKPMFIGAQLTVQVNARRPNAW